VTDRTSDPDVASGATRGPKPTSRWRLQSPRPVALGGALLAVAVLAAACAASAGSVSARPTSVRRAATPDRPASLTGATTTKGTVHAAKASGVGTVLVSSAGWTLYLFGPDKQKKVTCTGVCAKAWPLLYVTGQPKAGAGIKASLLGTIKAPNGKTQVTYNHWPLYGFVGDTKVGQAKGEGLKAFGGTWFAVNASGNRAKSTVHTAKANRVGTVVVSPAGRTLYLFGPDRQRKVTCTGVCAQSWPPLYVRGTPIAGPGIKASLLGTIKAPNGKTQVTYNHWPLYSFVVDTKAGQANGQGVRAFGGTWFAVNPSGDRAKSTAPTSPGSTTTTTTTTAPW
jgi:predicted lipoprotein with Yx(FWY)xxD motif